MNRTLYIKCYKDLLVLMKNGFICRDTIWSFYMCHFFSTAFISPECIICPVVSVLSRLWISCLDPLILLLPKFLKLFGFPIFQLWMYLLKVIPEIWYLHFYWTEFDYVILGYGCYWFYWFFIWSSWQL